MIRLSALLCSILVTPIAAVAGACDPDLPSGSRGFVLPHVLESVGGIDGEPSSSAFDSVVFLYGGGAGTELDFYFCDKETGLPAMGGESTPICDPCTVTVGPATQKDYTLRVDELIELKGGFSKDIYLLRVLIVATGDVANLAWQAWLVNVHEDAFRLAYEMVEPVEVSSF